ncbi:MAG: single-stranded-DNA-specific exonuclease [Methanolobus sp.]|nr:single-stranded-DNA-specific exonuclease [Methanolobus sp.]
MNFNVETKKLKDMARQAAAVIEDHDHVRVISHNDADGLTSASIICQALLRKGIRFHTTIVPRLDSSVADMVIASAGEKDLVLFCDMGSGQSGILSAIKNPMVILDHHIPVGDSPAKVVVNPHLVGIDGAMHISASGTTYLVAKALDPANVDLAGMAIAGAVGDKQLMDTVNGTILKEAVDAGVVTVRKGLRVGDGNIADVLEYTPEPYLDITGDRQRIEEFLSILGIRGEISGLSEEQLKKLTSAIALKLAKRSTSEAIDASIGDVYYLNKELVKNVYDLVSIFNTCGRMEKAGIAISIGMRDKMHLEEAMKMSVGYQREIVGNIKAASDMLRMGQSIGYLITKDMESTGMVASTMVRYINPDMPFVAVNQVEDIIKVSARGTRALVAKGLDLAFALREASKAVGGEGGGHNIASGASIPPGTEEQFIGKVDEIVGQQLGKESEGT